MPELRSYSKIYSNMFDQLHEVFNPLLQQIAGDGREDTRILLQEIIDNPDSHRSEVGALLQEYSLIYEPIVQVRDIQDNLTDLQEELDGSIQEDLEVDERTRNIVNDINSNLILFLNIFVDWQDFNEHILDRVL